MYALFLESKAAQQIDAYVAANGGDAEEIKQKAYYNSIHVDRDYGRGAGPEEQSTWWVNLCLKGDLHKTLDINSSFTWSSTPEGQNFWIKIHKYK